MELSYNTQQENIRLPEYGRGIQEMVEHLKLEKDRDKLLRKVGELQMDHDFLKKSLGKLGH